MRLKCGWPHDVTRQDALAKTWGKAFHLRFDGCCHVDRRTVRDMAVSPAGVLPCGRSARIRGGCLDVEHVRVRRVSTSGNEAFAGRHLIGSPGEVDGAGASQPFVFPRDRAVECPINLENPGTISPFRELPPITRGQRISGDLNHLAWRDVEYDSPVRGQLRQACSPACP